MKDRKKTEHHQTAKADKIPESKKIAYGTGEMGLIIMSNTVMHMASPVYNIGLGISPVLVGWANSIPRLWDAISDPLMGLISDRTRSRFGRRRPYIFVGSILSGIGFALIWFCPRGLSELATFGFLLAMSILFYTAGTIFTVPYNALGYEMTPDYHERTRLMAHRSFFGPIGGMLACTLFWFTQRSCFTDTVHGMRYVGAATGLFLLAVTILPAIFVKERPVPQQELPSKKINLFSDIKKTLTVKPYLCLIAAMSLILLGLLSVIQLGFYINVYYIFGGDIKASATVNMVGGVVYQILNLLAVFPVSKLATRYGKRHALIFFLCLAASGSLVSWFCLTPAAPWMQLVPMLLTAPGFAALWMLLNSMIPDICDYDELIHGERREGMFAATTSFVGKLGMSLAGLTAGYVLVGSGFNADLGAEQAEGVLTIIRILYCVVPAAVILLAILIFSKYPITEERAYEIRAELEKRRGSAL
jgi:glycoside/pentoside/hexuronide:cation symporter, GPH family